MNYVKIKVLNKDRFLEHFFHKTQSWGLPAGRIEEGETERQAAARELLERTGYEVNENNLISAGTITEDDTVFSLFEVDISDAKQVAKPGEKGGYETKIRWVKA